MYLCLSEGQSTSANAHNLTVQHAAAMCFPLPNSGLLPYVFPLLHAKSRSRLPNCPCYASMDYICANLEAGIHLLEVSARIEDSWRLTHFHLWLKPPNMTWKRW